MWSISARPFWQGWLLFSCCKLAADNCCEENSLPVQHCYRGIRIPGTLRRTCIPADIGSSPLGTGVASCGVAGATSDIEGRLSSVAYTDDECEGFSRFVDWLEGKREQAGLMPERLVSLGGGIKLSTYRRVVSFRNLWRRRGNADGKLEIPVSPQGMVGILRALSRRLDDENLLAEAAQVWGVTFPLNGHLPEGDRVEANILMEEVLHGIMDLPSNQLRLIRDLVDRLRNE